MVSEGTCPKYVKIMSFRRCGQVVVDSTRKYPYQVISSHLFSKRRIPPILV
jgi:hypothetical protein